MMRPAILAVLALMSGQAAAGECDPAFVGYNTFRMTARELQAALTKQGMGLTLPSACFRRARTYECAVPARVGEVKPVYLAFMFKCGGRFSGVWTEWPLDRRGELLAFAKSIVRSVGGGAEDVAAVDRLSDGFTTPPPRGEKFGSPGAALKGVACCDMETSQRTEKTMQLYLHSRTLFR